MQHDDMVQELQTSVRRFHMSAMFRAEKGLIAGSSLVSAPHAAIGMHPIRESGSGSLDMDKLSLLLRTATQAFREFEGRILAHVMF